MHKYVNKSINKGVNDDFEKIARVNEKKSREWTSMYNKKEEREV